LIIVRGGSTSSGRSSDGADHAADERRIAAGADACRKAGEAITGDGPLPFLLDQSDKLGRREHGQGSSDGVCGIDT
jgi:hypothetical protein